MDIDDIPRFSLNDAIFEGISRLNQTKEKCRNLIDKKLALILAKTSQIRSINSSLAIEGNHLEVYEVADILNGKEVVGPFDEIVETKNALRAYEMMPDLDLWSIDDFLKAQDEMMFGLVETPGFRNVQVVVAEGQKVIYMSPHVEEVGPLMERLFDWCRGSELPAPILGAVVHYYIEAIHPFEDGNGRMGRLWNTKVLTESDPIYGIAPMETYIARRREEYYAALERCQSMDPQDCTGFIMFCINCQISAFEDLSHLRDDKVSRLLDAMPDRPASLREIMSAMGFTSRGKFMDSYLRPAMEYGLVVPTEKESRSRYQKYRRLVRSPDTLFKSDSRFPYRECTMAIFKKAENPKASEEPVEETETKKRTNDSYFVSPHPDGGWQVKRSGAQKALKKFKTKAEAEAYAKQVASNQGVGVVRQKKDGKIQKKK